MGQDDNKVRGFALVDEIGRLLFSQGNGICDFKDLTDIEEGDEVIIFGTSEIPSMVLSLAYRKVIADLSSDNISVVEIIKDSKTKSFTIL
jgi:hypothetical protein